MTVALAEQNHTTPVTALPPLVQNDFLEIPLDKQNTFIPVHNGSDNALFVLREGGNIFVSEAGNAVFLGNLNTWRPELSYNNTNLLVADINFDGHPEFFIPANPFQRRNFFYSLVKRQEVDFGKKLFSPKAYALLNQWGDTNELYLPNPLFDKSSRQLCVEYRDVSNTTHHTFTYTMGKYFLTHTQSKASIQSFPHSTLNKKVRRPIQPV